MQIGLIYFHICPANKHLRLKMRGLPVYCQWLRRVLTFGTFLKYGPFRVTNDTATQRVEHTSTCLYSNE